MHGEWSDVLFVLMLYLNFADFRDITFNHNILIYTEQNRSLLDIKDKELMVINTQKHIL